MKAAVLVEIGQLELREIEKPKVRPGTALLEVHACAVCGSVEAHEQAIEIVRNRGYVNLFGGLAAGSRNLDVASNTIHYKECFVHGSHGSLPRHHQAALALIARGVVRADKYIPHRFPLEKIHDAFEAHRSRKALKVVVQPSAD